MNFFLGKNVLIGSNCEVSAAVIGLGVNIGDNCKIGERCVVKDYVRIEKEAVVPPNTVLPPFAVVAGNPAQIVGEQPASVTTTTPSDAAARFKSFVKT